MPFCRVIALVTGSTAAPPMPMPGDEVTIFVHGKGGCLETEGPSPGLAWLMPGRRSVAVTRRSRLLSRAWRRCRRFFRFGRPACL